ncbi:hypothetical protein ISS37_02270 [candidate division KSB1 bacterium]|nr:hypothetical protein [candidate division KSB1 bacterium]
MKRICFFIPGLVWALLNFVSCDDLFSTRSPEPPEGGQRSSWVPPTSPDIVLTNMKNAVQDLNSSDYQSCFSDTGGGLEPFMFKADQASLNNFPILKDWGLEEEIDFFDRLKPPFLPSDSTKELRLYPQSETLYSDSAVFIEDYVLTVNHTDSQIPQRVQGNAEFHLKRDEGGLWAITLWQDEDLADDIPPWSELKALLAD